MRTACSPLRTLAVCSALGAVLLAGCSDAEEPADEPGQDGVPAETHGGDAAEQTEDAAEETGDAAEETGDAAEETAEPVTITSADGAFTVPTPEGWEDAAESVEDEFEVALRDRTMRDDFYANVLVVRDEPIDDLEESIEESATDLAGENGSYELLDEVDLDGESALGYSVTRPHGDIERFFIQRWVVRDDQLYLITLTTVQTQQEAGTEALDEALAGWSWED